MPLSCSQSHHSHIAHSLCPAANSSPNPNCLLASACLQLLGQSMTVENAQAAKAQAETAPPAPTAAELAHPAALAGMAMLAANPFLSVQMQQLQQFQMLQQQQQALAEQVATMRAMQRTGATAGAVGELWPAMRGTSAWQMCSSGVGEALAVPMCACLFAAVFARCSHYWRSSPSIHANCYCTVFKRFLCVLTLSSESIDLCAHLPAWLQCPWTPSPRRMLPWPLRSRCPSGLAAAARLMLTRRARGDAAGLGAAAAAGRGRGRATGASGGLAPGTGGEAGGKEAGLVEKSVLQAKGVGHGGQKDWVGTGVYGGLVS